jgi:arylsulfatase A-like enzyme
MTARRPNILFLFSDQQRWDTLGCYGQPLPVTPHLDRLAREGCLVQNAFTCQPVCGPARAALQTGRYPTEIGCPTNHCMLPIDEPTIAKLLSATGYLGKWHLASQGPRNGPDDFRVKGVPAERRGGYKDFWLASDTLEFTSHGIGGHMFDGNNQRRDFPPGRFRADVQTDWLLEFLDSRTGDAPFFLFSSWIEPHHQNDRDRYEGPKDSLDRFANFIPPGDLVGQSGNWQREYADYLGCCAALDEGVGRIRAKLEERGMADNTIIIYTSDHGSHFRTRNGEYKRSCHDASIHVPMIVWGGPFTGGHAPAGLASLIDLPPTVLRAAEVPVPATMRGRPLQDLIAGAADWQDDVFIQISESQCGRAIRTDRWTYSVRAPDVDNNATNATRYVEDFLYDNRTDPHQRLNRVNDPALETVRADLRARLLKRMAAVGEPQAEILTAVAS